MCRRTEAARGAGSAGGATPRPHQKKLRPPARPVHGQAESPANGRRVSEGVLSRDRRCRPSTRRGEWPERLRSKGDCQPWDILAEGAEMEASSCRWVGGSVSPTTIETN